MAYISRSSMQPDELYHWKYTKREYNPATRRYRYWYGNSSNFSTISKDAMNELKKSATTVTDVGEKELKRIKRKMAVKRTLSEISSKTIAAGKKVAATLKALGQKISSVASKTINTGKNLLKKLKNPISHETRITLYTTNPNTGKSETIKTTTRNGKTTTSTSRYRRKSKLVEVGKDRNGITVYRYKNKT